MNSTGLQLKIVNGIQRTKFAGALLLISPALYAGSGQWSEVDHDDAGNPYIYIDSYGQDESISLMMKASGYDCSLELSTFEFSEAGETMGPFTAVHPKFRIDRQPVIEITELDYDVEHERDEDGLEYVIISSQWVPNDQFMSGFVSGAKLIYTHNGIGTIRWSLRGSARRLSELYQQCSLTAIEEDEWDEDESFSNSDGNGHEWNS